MKPFFPLNYLSVFFLSLISLAVRSAKIIISSVDITSFFFLQKLISLFNVVKNNDHQYDVKSN